MELHGCIQVGTEPVNDCDAPFPARKDEHGPHRPVGGAVAAPMAIVLHTALEARASAPHNAMVEVHLCIGQVAGGQEAQSRIGRETGIVSRAPEQRRSNGGGDEETIEEGRHG